jgi:hypothetical protein
MTHATNLSRWEADGGHIEEPADEARHAQADHVGRQMAAVAERLCREFAPGGGTAAESIRDQVRDARDAFGSPRGDRLHTGAGRADRPPPAPVLA